MRKFNKEQATKSELVDYIQEIEAELVNLKLAYNTLSGFYKNMVGSLEIKSTGLTKKPILNLPITDVEGYINFGHKL